MKQVDMKDEDGNKLTEKNEVRERWNSTLKVNSIRVRNEALR